MITPKRISLALTVTLMVSLLVILAATYRVEGTSAPTQTLRSKLLRRYDRTKEKPDAAELESLRKQSSQQEERALEDKTPKHVPIKIKIRAEKEKSFKDLNNEK